MGEFIGYHDELLTLVAAQRSHLGIPEKGKPWTTTKTVTYNRAKHQLAHPYRLIQIISPHFQLACKIFLREITSTPVSDTNRGFAEAIFKIYCPGWFSDVKLKSAATCRWSLELPRLKRLWFTEHVRS